MDYERAYNLLLDAALLVLPLLVLSATYVLITRTLWRGMKLEQHKHDENGLTCTDVIVWRMFSGGGVEVYMGLNGTATTRRQASSLRRLPQRSADTESPAASRGHVLRRTNAGKSLVSKRRVIQMLFVVVLEFFLCWTPLYVINTIALFDGMAVYSGLGYTGISFFQLLAYSSSCCNPITYCFMNSSFRKSFLNVFGCRKLSCGLPLTSNSGGSPCGGNGRGSSMRQRQGVLLCSWMEAADTVKRRETQSLGETSSAEKNNGETTPWHTTSIQ
ncbi:hypothetical protein B566_EDAN002791 [Ephemera danica]|nr:hypothetical protein B566_EDAN002791 [Ephemera danica]